MHEAFAASQHYVELWRVARQQPDAPLFSGGVLDAWPAIDTAALQVMQAEDSAIGDLMRHEATKVPHG